MGRETAPPEGEEDMEKTAEQETAKTFQRTRMVVMAAAFAALACVATMVVKVPSPTGGYMNLGDTVVLLGGYLLGPAWGALAGSIGPALADVLLGSPIYAPATLVIKAGMAALAAACHQAFGKGRGPLGLAACGVVGELPEAVPTLDYLREAGRRLRVGALRHSRIVHERVRRVAVCTGAGGSLLGEALRAGAELYLTADLKYNDFMAPSGRLTVADIGHFESEYCAIEILFEIFSKNLRTFAVRKSRCSCNPVNYLCL